MPAPDTSLIPGQVATPLSVAKYIVSIVLTSPAPVRILDAGAGEGALTLALIDRLCDLPLANRPFSVYALLIEKDPALVAKLQMNMDQARKVCFDNAIQLTWTVKCKDFILESSAFGIDPFDVALLNPPYAKIGTKSPEYRKLVAEGITTANLYTGFMFKVSKYLAPGGQMVSITPRSFCNGVYFRNFRAKFLESMELHAIHLYESRREAFKDANVLQEVVICHAVKGDQQPPTIAMSTVKNGVSSSLTRHLSSRVICGPDRRIRMPTGYEDVLPKGKDAYRLEDLGLSVSTGKIVGYRLKEFLRDKPEPGTVPIIYPSHFGDKHVVWPNFQTKHPNAIVDDPKTRPWFVPLGVYVLVKRISPKEYPRRVVACIFDPLSIKGRFTLTETGCIGFENHLNYFHVNGNGLPIALARGLFAYLSSSDVDSHIREVNGTTQVGAADLRALPYPSMKELCEMGAEE